MIQGCQIPIKIKIGSLISCSPLLMCCGVENLNEHLYGSHASDLMHHPMKMVIVRL